MDSSAPRAGVRALVAASIACSLFALLTHNLHDRAGEVGAYNRRRSGYSLAPSDEILPLPISTQRLRMRTQAVSPAVGPAGRSSLTALLWCFVILISPGLLAGVLLHGVGGEFALGGILSGALGVSAGYSGWALTNAKWSGISTPLISNNGGRRLLIASVLAQLWWLAVALLMLKGPQVTVWMEVGLLPPLIVGSVGLDIARRAYTLPADA